MKKVILIITLLVAFVLSGCSLLEDVNKSLEYVEAVTEHVEMINTVSEDIPPMLQDAVTDPEVKANLEDQLTTLQEDIQEFNQLEPPEIAADLHEQIVNKNLEIIDAMLMIMDNGEIAVEKLENIPLDNMPIVETVNQLNDIATQIEELEF